MLSHDNVRFLFVLGFLGIDNYCYIGLVWWAYSWNKSCNMRWHKGVAVIPYNA